MKWRACSRVCAPASVLVAGWKPENGIVEALVTVAVFLLTYSRLAKSVTKAVLVLVVGYGFAWLGHFVFEKNRPATFIYPCFSLASDFKLWYEIASRQRAF